MSDAGSADAAGPSAWSAARAVHLHVPRPATARPSKKTRVLRMLPPIPRFDVERARRGTPTRGLWISDPGREEAITPPLPGRRDLDHASALVQAVAGPTSVLAGAGKRCSIQPRHPGSFRAMVAAAASPYM